MASLQVVRPDFRKADNLDLLFCPDPALHRPIRNLVLEELDSVRPIFGELFQKWPNMLRHPWVEVVRNARDLHGSVYFLGPTLDLDNASRPAPDAQGNAWLIVKVKEFRDQVAA